MRKNILVIFLLFNLIPAVIWAAPNPDNGTVREYYPNGNLRLENKFRDEKIVRHRTFYENGRLLGEWRYKDGILYKTKFFYENGQPKSVWTKKSGETRLYESDGKLKTILQMNSNPKLKSSYIFSGQ